MKEIMQRFFLLVNYLKMKEEGQGLAEYALILVLVAIACVLALTFLGGSINNVLSNVATEINSHPSSS